MLKNISFQNKYNSNNYVLKLSICVLKKKYSLQENIYHKTEI